VRSWDEGGGGGGWNARSENDFPSFFLNFVRFIDAPDRTGAVNLVARV